MNDSFIESVNDLVGKSVVKIESCDGSIKMHLSDGVKISSTFWRLLGLQNERLSSFDDGMKYGLTSSVDSHRRLAEVVVGKALVTANFTLASGDLEFEFVGSLKLQIFNFSGNEVWEVEFAEGSGQLSNFV